MTKSERAALREHWRQSVTECENRDASISKRAWCEEHGALTFPARCGRRRRVRRLKSSWKWWMMESPGRWRCRHLVVTDNFSIKLYVVADPGSKPLQ